METVTEINYQPYNQFEVVNETVSTNKEDVEMKPKFSPHTTIMCTDNYVDNVCTLIASMASKWEYFESEIIYLITKRLEIFFGNFSGNTSELGIFFLLFNCIIQSNTFILQILNGYNDVFNY